MNESILDSIKKLLGLEPEYTPFDSEIVTYINSALITLKQLGIGGGFMITGAEETYADFLTAPSLLPLIKNYIVLKVKIVWDVNSLNSNTLSAYKEQIAELEWRIREENEQVIYPNGEDLDD